MNNCVCRALTFMSYHIPLPKGIENDSQYKTIGFFDGLYTEQISLDYMQEDLHPLWEYTSKRTKNNKGYYSFQNIFGFSRDAWNDCEDEKFWSKETDQQYPLTFVVFMQLGGYISNNNSIKTQCIAFNRKVKNSMDSEALSYVYGTVDKNDFIVCIKSKTYGKAVKAVKLLHNNDEAVIYSYTVFSVRKEILEEIGTVCQNYKYLYEENIDSICLKGISNNYHSNSKFTLDQKYYEFCRKLVERLYGESVHGPDGKDPDRKLYDILGDDDFRFIARNVSLGKLLKEFASDGMLCYERAEFSFYLLSSNLILNTSTVNEGDQLKPIDWRDRRAWIDMRNEASVAPFCSALESEMEDILNKSYEDEKIITFCQGIYQLLQSLKVLENAPTKKYDFISIYIPFSLLVRILESKLVERKDIGEKEEIYDFIHTISMTLHGTFRTDIQFIQIRDFNVITHYAPAKLRAFYSMWALKLSAYYNMVGMEETNLREYSFVFAPGMHKGTKIKELFQEDEEKNHLMLITIPERHLYSVKWLSVLLAHEVSHFVGSQVRNRSGRHRIWSDMVMRILELEFYSFTYVACEKVQVSFVEKIFGEKQDLWGDFEKEILEQEKEICRENDISCKYRYHSENSCKIIKLTHDKILNTFFKQIIYDYCYSIKKFISETWNHNNGDFERTLTDGELNDYINGLSDDMFVFYRFFAKNVLNGLLGVIQHITTETFADMMAILTLGLTPRQYIMSFTNSEMSSYVMDRLNENETTIIAIRIAIVMQAVTNIVKKYNSCFEKEHLENLQIWSGDVLVRCANELKSSSSEGKIVYKALGYRDKIEDFRENISEYKALFDPSRHEFQLNMRNFLEDKFFWESACDYLEQCADIYVKKLCDCSSAEQVRGELLEMYKTISGNSSVDLMQEIENFLEKSEREFNAG